MLAAEREFSDFAASYGLLLSPFAPRKLEKRYFRGAKGDIKQLIALWHRRISD